MKHKPVHYFAVTAAMVAVSARVNSAEMLDAVELIYKEIEENTEPYTVRYQVTRDHIRIDDESDSSGYIVFDIKGNTIYSVSHYDKSILEAPASSESGSSDGDDEYDEKWDEALAVVADAKQASISMLQRRLRLGYNRAARMIEKMEAEGIVGPSDGTSRPREVFINKIGGDE